jgi:phage tail sheath gpL-like
MSNLTTIANRLTPSVPMQITFAAQPVATGRKFTTLFGHMAATPGTATAYSVHTVVSVGDPDAAKAEVDALAGAGSQIGKMAYAFVKANSAVGGTNFPAFRVVFLDSDDTGFGDADEAIAAVKFLRTDMFVSCYPAGDSANRQKLLDLCGLLNGIDRNLMGQFGSFASFGSIEALSVQADYEINSRACIIHSLPDTSPTPSQKPEILASACAAAMMALAFPYVPAKGITIGGLVPPAKTSDWVAIDPTGASEVALAAGLSPLYVQPGNTMGFIRTRTTYTTLPDGVTSAIAYIDWQDLVVLYDFREQMYQVSQNPPFNNNPGGAKASKQIAAAFKDELLRIAFDFESAGAFQNVKELAPYFVVQQSSTSPGRLDFRLPVDVIPGLMVLAGNIVAISDLDQLSTFSV